jgi:hypothetical protein
MKQFFKKHPVLLAFLFFVAIVFVVILVHVAKQAPPHICGLDDGFHCGYWEKVREISLYAAFFIILLASSFGILGLVPYFIIQKRRSRK